MAERSRRTAAPLLDVRGLNVFYGRSHALQGVDLQLATGVLAIVGRNGMGKTTLCKTIMGLVPAASGSIRFAGHELVGLVPSQVARLGVGYVPQGRRLWPSLTVDEHLRLVVKKGGAWDVARIYATFPRLGERKSNRGGQLSGGEQQMLAISRALLQNPKLLVLDEPTEGLAPVIVAQVEEMLAGLASEGEMGVLVIEQNIGVACTIAPTVAIMVNGRVNRVMDSATLGADRDLQQRLLGVGRHGHEDAPADMLPAARGAAEAASPAVRKGPARVYLSNPALPTRWSQPVPAAKIEAAARTMTALPSSTIEVPVAATELRPLSASGDAVVLVAGTLDTKGAELRFLRDTLRERGIRTRLVDLSTSGKPSSAEVTPNAVALHHPSGPGAVFSGDRGTAVAAMAEAFERFVRRTPGIAGIVSAGGSGGTALVTPAMRALPLGVPKLMVSTVASGDTSRYVGPSDILMLPSVTDVAGLNPVLRQVLANAANAVAGMVEGRRDAKAVPTGKPALGLTMFGLTTPAVRAVSDALGQDYEPLVFHATGIGGRSMERLIAEGVIDAVVDLTTTEIADMMMGGVFPATEDRFGAVIRRKKPYVGSVGALDMVNFGAPDTVPERYRGRIFYQHNPQITLMRTTRQENQAMGEWIGERLNRMEAPVRFLLPEGGVSGLDAPGMAFHDPEATRALFAALEATVRQTTTRRLVRVPHHINDPAFAAAVVEHFRALHGDARRQRARR